MLRRALLRDLLHQVSLQRLLVRLASAFHALLVLLQLVRRRLGRPALEVLSLTLTFLALPLRGPLRRAGLFHLFSLCGACVVVLLRIEHLAAPQVVLLDQGPVVRLQVAR